MTVPPSLDPKLSRCSRCALYFDIMDMYLVFAPKEPERKRGRTELHHCEPCMNARLKRPLRVTTLVSV